MGFLISLAVYIAFLIIGSLCIADAIAGFNDKKYFQFGINILLALSCVFWIAKYVFAIW